MSYDKKVMDWNNEGIEPPGELISGGWKAGMSPAPAYFNAFWSQTSKAIKELQSKAYEKPVGGIGETDLSQSVKDALKKGSEAVNKEDLDKKANIDSPSFTGKPTAPTAVESSNDTQLANTAFVKRGIEKHAMSNTHISEGVAVYADNIYTLTGVTNFDTYNTVRFKAPNNYVMGAKFKIGTDIYEPVNADFENGELLLVTFDKVQKKAFFKTGGGENKTLPPQIDNFVAKEDDKKIKLSWTISDTTFLEDYLFVYKKGSAPQSSKDGQQMIVSKSARTTEITGLENDATYYVRAYPRNAKRQLQTIYRVVSATPASVKIYGVAIADNNTNPETAVTYTDNAIGTQESSAWNKVYPFNDIRPFLVKDGVEVVELNKSDFTKNISGGSVDITSGTSGDVMIRFPKIWWKMYKADGNQYVKYATQQVDSTWKSLAHINSRTGVECDYVYISAYLGYSDGSKLRSLSGKTPTVSTELATFRTLAQSNGANYNQIGFYQLTMLQILYLIRYKNLDSQTALGRGYVDGNTAKTNTGGTNSKGMYYGETTGKLQMKFAGLEDFWGNCYYYIDGLKTNSNNDMQIGTEYFNDNGTSATIYPSGIGNTSGYMSDIQGTTETAFNIKTAGGSDTTRYSDIAYLSGGYFAVFGGDWNDASSAGAFQLNVTYGAAGYSNVAARFALFK